MIAEQLLQKFESRQAHVAVIGLGYVGLPLAVIFAEAGYSVIGIDVDPQKVDAINRGESYIEDIPSALLARYTQQTVTVNGSAASSRSSSTSLTPVGTLHATTDFSVLADCDAVSICVPTPLNKTGGPDISYIIKAADEIARRLHPGMVVVLESTTYPGTTTEAILPRLLETNSHLKVGEDFFLCFSPERIDPGRTDWTAANTPKIMGGVTPTCRSVGQRLYGSAIKTIVPVSSTEAAEMVKLLENTFRAVNIGLVNEVLLMCDKLGLDAWEVIEAAATKPFGFMKFTPGPGLGGHCIPIDPLYLSWKLKTLDYNARFIELASEINTSMPRYWVQKVQDALNDQGKPVKGSTILVLGVAYKKDVSDLRESPALDIIHLLEAKGARVQYHDPHVPMFQHEHMEMVSVPVLEDSLRHADCVIIATDHTGYDWNLILHQATLLIDTRGTIKQSPLS
ncbi:MAG: nucleotide sugar dehydrogenase [Ardenticatenales bacterium]|nr:nucleotide sugar dehydrogenase [Ardenticatenales bacterium]